MRATTLQMLNRTEQAAPPTGDAAASDDLGQQIVECLPELGRVVAHYFRNEHDREEAVNDIVVTLMEKGDSFRGDAPFSHWALAIASRSCISRLRREKLRRFFSLNGAEHEQYESEDRTEKSAEREDTRRILYRALDELSGRDRELILLSDIMEKDDTELISILKIKAGALRVRRHRAREKLKVVLRRLGYEHDGQ